MLEPPEHSPMQATHRARTGPHTGPVKASSRLAQPVHILSPLFGHPVHMLSPLVGHTENPLPAHSPTGPQPQTHLSKYPGAPHHHPVAPPTNIPPNTPL